MAIFYIDTPQKWVHIYSGPPDTHISVPFPETVYCCINPLPFIPPLLLRIKGQLEAALGFYQTGSQ